MSTAVSMHSPNASFGSRRGQMSPAFRTLHAVAIRQRQRDVDRMRELARSDEFSDDESDGVDSDEEDDDGEDDGDDDDEDVGREERDAAEADLDALQRRQMNHYMASPARRMLVQMQLSSQQRHALSSPRDSERSDSEIEDTVLLPFIRPVVMQPVTSSETGSPKVSRCAVCDSGRLK
ncbi:hypothetical protein ATCC90586_000607 [Pythium insidiosum]|nr:hypothetical protein ATCC90586_000607 [Pythium insidiosum]